MATCFEVAPEGKAWVVRFQAKVFGRYHTQKEAFDLAVAVARKLKEINRTAQVRVVHEDNESFGAL